LDVAGADAYQLTFYDDGTGTVFGSKHRLNNNMTWKHIGNSLIIEGVDHGDYVEPVIYFDWDPDPDRGWQSATQVEWIIEERTDMKLVMVTYGSIMGDGVDENGNRYGVYHDLTYRYTFEKVE
jgi:hypothetical protein